MKKKGKILKQLYEIKKRNKIKQEIFETLVDLKSNKVLRKKALKEFMSLMHPMKRYAGKNTTNPLNKRRKSNDF